MMNSGDAPGVRLHARGALVAALACSLAFMGCGGADQTTGSQAEQDAAAAKSQDEMRQFYKKNPLPKPKRVP